MERLQTPTTPNPTELCAKRVFEDYEELYQALACETGHHLQGYNKRRLQNGIARRLCGGVEPGPETRLGDGQLTLRYSVPRKVSANNGITYSNVIAYYTANT